MLYRSLFLLILLAPISLFGQLKVLTGTTVKVNTGTTVEFTSADSLKIESGSQFQNNGRILLFSDYTVLENSGYPIYGSGKEVISFNALPSMQFVPGNLGFKFVFQDSGQDTLILERFHDTLPGFNHPTINRYFKLFNDDSSAVSISDIRISGDTSEYHQTLPQKWHVITGNISQFINAGTDTSGTLFSKINDTLSGYSLFSVSPYVFEVDSLNPTFICQNDSFLIIVPLIGAFEEGSTWYAILSDENGNFPGNGISDTTSFISGNLNFMVPGNTLPSANYLISVSDSAGIVHEEFGNYTIYNLPDLPLISVSMDTLFCQQYTIGTMQWYYNDVLISGATDSMQMATSNGIYTVEFISPNGCVSSSDFNYTFNGYYYSQGLDEFSPYPNPFTEEINIYLAENSLVKIWDALGKTVFENIFLKGENKLNLTSVKMEPGIYFLNIGQQTFKLIKE